MAIPTFAELQKMSAAEQDAFFTSYFGTFKGTVTAAWVKNDSGLSPYLGETALGMYQKLKTAYPNATPLQRGSTVYQAWLVNGAGSTIQKIVGASGDALGDVKTGIETTSFLPSWADGLAGFLADITSQNLWIRVAKIVIGGTLIIVGISKMSGASNVVTQIAEKAPVPV
jgi:hypothetical protein